MTDKPDSLIPSARAGHREQGFAIPGEELRTLFAAITDAIVAIDKNGRVTFMNPAAEAPVGWKPSELVGREMHDAIHYQRADGTPRPATECPILGVLHTGKAVKVESDVFTRRDGTLLPVSYTCSPVIAGGKVAGAVLAFRDTNERNVREERIRQTQRVETIGQLAGGIAHDFNNLLIIINSSAEILMAQWLTSEARQKHLLAIQHAGERAAVLTKRLLAFSRREILQPQMVSLARVVAGIEPILRRLVPEDIDITVRLDRETGQVKADPAQLEQVIINLAVNARDAMPRGGRLIIETATGKLDESYALEHPEAALQPYALLTVTDTGVGMTEATKARIFEPFFTTKETGKGTGLGLAMVSEFVRQSGGYISVHSKSNSGTAFKIYLSLIEAREGQAQASAEAAQHAPLPTGTETVLLVEDNDGVRECVMAMLQQHGYTVVAARNGDEALAYSATLGGGIDLLITDVVMPGRSGPGLAKELARDRAQMKVLYMSGYTEETIAAHGVLASGVAFLAKPFTTGALCHRVREIFDGPKTPEKKPAVLVVDDEEAILALLREPLTAAGYEVFEATNGKQAERIGRSTKIDVLITDLVMPDQEGMQTIRAFRRNHPDTRIIAISGAFETDRLLQVARHLGAAAAFAKPFNIAELLNTVRALLP
ncbi:MAG TPA: response regulator [Verrucomicrobiae bacterium]|jgi:two-component system cell cycle sensor histidine kinase/response regulator CckA|nr:response regulator [Verrucomicrobiae bacterium]